jgi:hypothetical protein
VLKSQNCISLPTEVFLVRVRVRVTLRLAVYRQSVRLGAKLLETYDQYIFQLNTYGYSLHITSSLTFTIAAGPRQRSHSRVRVSQDSCPHFTVSDSRHPNLEGQVPVFISPRNRVAQLYPEALGSLFLASYVSQGYGGGIRTRLHTGLKYS